MESQRHKLNNLLQIKNNLDDLLANYECTQDEKTTLELMQLDNNEEIKRFTELNPIILN